MSSKSALRTAASLLVVAPSSQILFMLRPSTGSFPSTHVFPGGAYEADSDSSLSYTALRETYEETGLLLGPQPETKPVVHAVGEYPSYDSAFKHVFGLNPQTVAPPQKATSTAAIGSHLSSDSWWAPQNEKKLGLDRLSSWTTPVHLPKRFGTQFFVCKVPEAYSFPELPPISAAPGADRGGEVELLEWLTPLEALTLFREGKIKLMPPQFYLMTLILEHGLDGAIARLKDRNFTPEIVNKLPDGRVEMNWGKGESGIIKFNKRGIVDSIEFIRAQL